MFVVRTIPQQEEAIRESAHEVLVVGKLAPKMLKIKDPSSKNASRDFPERFSLNALFEKYNIYAVHDSGKNVIATVFRQRGSLSMPSA